jgi:4-hydroxy-2-oxoglutarate aldolase
MIRGILPPLTTPFRGDGALDTAAFEANLEIYATQDLGGALVLGSNGEAQNLEEPEKLALVRTARARMSSRTLLVGTGLESTRATIALTRKVADLGADAVLVLTPHYYKSQMSPDALRAHFEAVADGSSIPVLLYSVPAFTGITFPAGLAAELARHPLVRGIKESSGDLGLLGRLVASVPPRFGVICGSAPVIYPALCIGAVGGILAAACCAPRPVTALYQAFQEGDHARARRIQEAIAPLAVAITATHGVAGLKAAMDLAGFRGGPVRAPLLPVRPEVRDELRALLDRAERSV